MSADHIVQIIPGGGWLVEHQTDDGGGAYTAPLVAWGLTARGDILPIDGDSEGFAVPLEGAPRGKWRLVHPDEHEGPAT